MNNITRYDPINTLTRFDLPMNMDDVFNRFMMRPFLRGAMELEPQIKMDVKEADGKYLVTAEIPGVNKDDIHVTVDGNRVAISAEVKQENESKESGRTIFCERNYGMTSRSFTLEDDIDQNQIQAKYNNGLLELTLAKKPGSTRKQIPIS